MKLRLSMNLFFLCFLLVFFGALVPSSYAAYSSECTLSTSKLFSMRIIPKAGGKNFKINLDKTVPTLFSESEHHPIPTVKKVNELAHHYKVVFTHNDTPVELNLIIPANSKNRKKLEIMEFVLKELPSIALREINSIILYPSSAFWIKHESAEFRPQSKSIFLAPSYLKKMQKLWILEEFQYHIGNVMANKYYGSFRPDKHWVEAMKADNMVSANSSSEISIDDIDKDFASTVAHYLEFEAGSYSFNARRHYPHRYRILDRVFEVDTTELLDKIVNHQGGPK